MSLCTYWYWCTSQIELIHSVTNFTMYLLVFLYIMNGVGTSCHKYRDVSIWSLQDSTSGVTNVMMNIYSLCTSNINNIGIYFPNFVCCDYVLRESTTSEYACIMTSVASRTMTQESWLLYDSNMGLKAQIGQKLELAPNQQYCHGRSNYNPKPPQTYVSILPTEIISP